MYNSNSITAIAKKRYSFRKGYYQVRLTDKNELRKELMQALGITRLTYFSYVLNKGIVDISLPKFELINQAFARRNITDVWDITELPQSSQPERAR